MKIYKVVQNDNTYEIDVINNNEIYIAKNGKLLKITDMKELESNDFIVYTEKHCIDINTNNHTIYIDDDICGVTWLNPSKEYTEQKERERKEFNRLMAQGEQKRAEKEKEERKRRDSGKYGKAFEIAVKEYLNGNKGNSHKVTPKGKTDVQFKGLKIEIKSNCGELNSIEKNDYVIYSMDSKTDHESPQKAHVIPSHDFLAIIEECGLMRTKKTTAGYRVKAIQTYKNSKRKTALLENALNHYPTLAEWKEQF